MARKYFKAQSREDYFWHYVERGEGCWLWTGPTVESGRKKGRKTVHIYGVVRYSRTHERAHRVSWELHRGPIPHGAQIDHLCRNTLCVNPEHLEPVTNAVNTIRGRAAEVNRARQLSKTECPHGHPLDGLRGGQRYCKTCHRERERKRRANRTS